jgi:hypothetical protein
MSMAKPHNNIGHVKKPLSVTSSSCRRSDRRVVDAETVVEGVVVVRVVRKRRRLGEEIIVAKTY